MTTSHEDRSPDVPLSRLLQQFGRGETDAATVAAAVRLSDPSRPPGPLTPEQRMQRMWEEADAGSDTFIDVLAARLHQVIDQDQFETLQRALGQRLAARSGEPSGRWTLVDERTGSGGWTHRSVQLREDGSLTLIGHDLGAEVEGVLGASEYEFDRTYDPDEVALLSRFLGLADHDEVVTALRMRCGTFEDIEQVAREAGVEGRFWSRVGD